PREGGGPAGRLHPPARRGQPDAGDRPAAQRRLSGDAGGRPARGGEESDPRSALPGAGPNMGEVTERLLEALRGARVDIHPGELAAGRGRAGGSAGGSPPAPAPEVAPGPAPPLPEPATKEGEPPAPPLPPAEQEQEARQQEEAQPSEGLEGGPPSGQVAIHLPEAEAGAPGKGRGRTLIAPSAKALPDELLVLRALRPLMRRVADWR